MARRSLKGHVAACSSGFVRLLNLVVLLAGIPIIVLQFVIKPSPTVAGWGFVAVGIVTVLSGLMGIISTGQWGCMGCHMLALMLSSAGLVAIAISTFVNKGRVYEILSPSGSSSQANQLIMVNAIICAAAFAFQMLVLLMGCMMSCCNLHDYYEDLEKQTSERELAKQQVEEERRRARIEATSAHQLAVKMKEKYGSFSSDPTAA